MNVYLLALRSDPCAYCGGPADVLDHVDAKARGGDSGIENLTAACNPCNQSKNARPLLSFLLHRNRPRTVGQEIHRSFGQRMRARRLELGLSQNELALSLGTDPMNISRWERGASGPRARSLVDLARMLGVSEAWFYRDVDLKALRAAA